MSYILGIDQGGTKTHALVADSEGHLLGMGTGGGSCHSIQGMAHAMAAVKEAADQAMLASGILPKQVQRVCAGMTGIDWPDEAALVRDALQETLGIDASRITAVNDCIIALRAGTSSAKGVILCAGTGLNCAVLDGAGGEYTYGFYIPDADQGGMALGMRTLQAVYDAESGLGPRTRLTAAVLAFTGCDSTDELLRRQVTGKLSGRTILSLPPILDEAAVGGDAVAIDVLCTYAHDISRYVTAGLRRMNLAQDAIEVVLSGSIFKCRAQVLAETIREDILAFDPDAKIIDSEYEPVIGAVLLALDAEAAADPRRITEHIKRDASRFDMIRKTKEKERTP